MPDFQLFKYFESIDDPRHDTIARVMSRIDMMQFQDSFSSWMKGLDFPAFTRHPIY